MCIVFLNELQPTGHACDPIHSSFISSCQHHKCGNAPKNIGYQNRCYVGLGYAKITPNGTLNVIMICRPTNYTIKLTNLQVTQEIASSK